MRKLRDETVLKQELFVERRDKYKGYYELILWGGAIVIGIVRSDRAVWSFYIHGIGDESRHRIIPHKTSSDEFASNRIWPCLDNGFAHAVNAIIAAKDYINERDNRGLDLEY